MCHFPDVQEAARGWLASERDREQRTGVPPPAILLVDDDDAVREALGELLRSRGFEVSEARDGAEALQLLESRRPALVVTDLCMPRIDGRALVRHLRDHPTLAATPVLVCSSSAEHVSAADRHIAKPLHCHELWHTIRELLGATARPGPA